MASIEEREREREKIMGIGNGIGGGGDDDDYDYDDDDNNNNNNNNNTRVGTLIVPTINLQLIQNGYKFRSFTVLHCSHQHCVQPVASDVEVVGYL